MNCPVCNKKLAKKYRRGMTEVQWLKLQVAYWMHAWNQEMDRKRAEMIKPGSPRNRA